VIDTFVSVWLSGLALGFVILLALYMHHLLEMDALDTVIQVYGLPEQPPPQGWPQRQTATDLAAAYEEDWRRPSGEHHLVWVDNGHLCEGQRIQNELAADTRRYHQALNWLEEFRYKARRELVRV